MAPPQDPPRIEPIAVPGRGGDEVEESELEDQHTDLHTDVSDPTRPTAGSGGSDPAGSGATGAITDDEAQQLYDRGYTLFHERRYTAAEASFRRFLDLDDASALADNAAYWIGECLFAQARYEAGLAAFMETVERFPEGNKVPDALFKAARSLELLGRRDEAEASYQEVIRQFPNSGAAASAEERLALFR